MQFIPLIVASKDRSHADGGRLYCAISDHAIDLDRCERCQFHVEITKQDQEEPIGYYGVQCSFVKEAPCMHDGCEEIGGLCYLGNYEAKEVYEYYCAEHAQEHGYCYMCGQFWAGIEDFDFAPSGMCSNCRDEYLDEDEYGGDEAEYDGWEDPYDVDIKSRCS